MEPSASSVVATDRRYQVPDELMKRLHVATEQFSAAKRHLDAVLSSPIPTEREKDSARAQIREAGKQLDQLDEKIHSVLHA